jgi:hypothetical protein
MGGINPWDPNSQEPVRQGGVALAGNYFGVYGCHPPVVLGGAKAALEEVSRLLQT